MFFQPTLLTWAQLVFQPQGWSYSKSYELADKVFPYLVCYHD
ncbi:hypothetical protein CEV33_0064 [Brucella grignonensis]|uniref:Uncharacterized protein n=1 Tax=Brucella grignonensis TaxID=94627 RepID=A0A256FMD4_9HYPH|nr:hypothetical protein CEV33_0064 [Brucella grignonensis]